MKDNGVMGNKRVLVSSPYWFKQIQILIFQKMIRILKVEAWKLKKGMASGRLGKERLGVQVKRKLKKLNKKLRSLKRLTPALLNELIFRKFLFNLI